MLKSTTEENWGQKHLADQCLYWLLEKIDTELLAAIWPGDCPHCQCRLDRGDYDRKPRGGPQWDRRFSLCCSGEGCRRRLTPPSVRFLGRRVYAGLVVVLVSAMTHGLNRQRVQRLREELGMDRRTLERWRQWWLNSFVRGEFWKSARSRFMPPLDEAQLPRSLWEVFGNARDRVAALLQFLAPLTTTSAPESRAM